MSNACYAPFRWTEKDVFTAGRATVDTNVNYEEETEEDEGVYMMDKMWGTSSFPDDIEYKRAKMIIKRAVRIKRFYEKRL